MFCPYKFKFLFLVKLVLNCRKFSLWGYSRFIVNTPSLFLWGILDFFNRVADQDEVEPDSDLTLKKNRSNRKEKSDPNRIIKKKRCFELDPTYYNLPLFFS